MPKKAKPFPDDEPFIYAIDFKYRGVAAIARAMLRAGKPATLAVIRERMAEFVAYTNDVETDGKRWRISSPAKPKPKYGMVSKFIQGDCVTEMRKLPAKSVDLIVTSPPYNAGKAYKSYSDKLSLEAYREFAKEWVGAAAHCLSDTGSFWLNVGYTKLGPNETLPLTYLYHPIAEEFGLRLVQEIVWHNEGGMAYKKRFSHRTERWMWFAKDCDNLTFNLDDVRDSTFNRTVDRRNNPLGKNPTDYWYFDRVVGGNGAGSEKTAHPCQFPRAMIERIVKACSNPSDTVLDPFGGSGTTAVVAAKHGRQAISIELDPDYHRISQDRSNQPRG